MGFDEGLLCGVRPRFGDQTINPFREGTKDSSVVQAGDHIGVGWGVLVAFHDRPG